MINLNCLNGIFLDDVIKDMSLLVKQNIFAERNKQIVPDQTALGAVLFLSTQFGTGIPHRAS